MKKRLRRRKKKEELEEKGLGGIIGSVAGAIGGTFIGNPMLGAQIGGALGGGVDTLIANNKNRDLQRKLAEEERRANMTTASGSLGIMRKGGRIKYKNRGKTRGSIQSIGQDAVKFHGPSHEEGGIPLPNTNAEVEGGETMDNIAGSDYVFSEKLIVPDTNKSFADVHEELVQSGASEEEIAQLAQLQEQVAGRTKKRFGGALRKKYGVRK